MMINAQFDKLFDSAFGASDALDHIPVDHHPSWLRVQKRLNARGNRKNFRSALTKLAVIAASLMIGAVIFGNTRAAKAIEPIYATLKEYPSGMMSFFFGRTDDSDSSKAKTAPPPAYAEGLNVEKITDTTYKVTANKEQSSRLLSFRVPVFGYVPDGYDFEDAYLYFSDGKEKADSVTYIFVNEQEKSVMVSMDRLKSNTALGSVTHTEEILSEKIELDGVPAILYTTEDGDSFLETVKSGIYTQISGKISKDELIRLYEELYKG